MIRRLKSLAATQLRALGRRAAQGYVAGPALADALRVCARLSEQGFASTTCFWNTDQDAPIVVAQAYRDALDQLARSGLDGYLSIKAPGLGFQRELLDGVLAASAAAGVRLHFDSLDPSTVDRTFALIAEIQPHPTVLGCTLPGRWRRSVADAEVVVARGLAVRIVKGQWADPLAPGLDPRGGFLAVVDALAGRASRVAVASHDPPLAREALRRLQAAGTPCELELLYGLPMKAALQVARERGVRARIYVPYGHAWLPYALGQARRNPRILWWLLRDAVTVSANRSDGRPTL